MKKTRSKKQKKIRRTWGFAPAPRVIPDKRRKLKDKLKDLKEY